MSVKPTTTVHARVSTGWNMPAADSHGPDVSGGASPMRWIGAPAAGGLTLPDASPTANHLYAPRGVWIDGARLIVADTGNHRVLIWNDIASRTDHSEADVVLGQTDFITEGAQSGGIGPECGMNLPTGVLVHDGHLVIADAWNHRVLIWNTIPTVDNAKPDVILGQRTATSTEPNANGACAGNTFYWPFGVAMIDGWFWIADTGNRRVLGWPGLPEPGDNAQVVLGQPDAATREENGGSIGANSFRWPHAIAGSPDGLVVADAGDHRLLQWHNRPGNNEPAANVYGQADFTSAVELPYAPQSARTLRFPYAVDIDNDHGGRMAVADTANNRVLLWDTTPTASNTPADRVLGQFDFTTIGENRWDCVAADTFCWPYGLSLHDNMLAVADSGNNRVMIWRLASTARPTPSLSTHQGA